MACRDRSSERERDAAAEAYPFIVPDEHRAAILEGLQQIERGEFATNREMAALWKKCGL
jgi:predicted transcriptional regulator